MKDSGVHGGTNGSTGSFGPHLGASVALASTGGSLVAFQIFFNSSLSASGSGPLFASLLSYAGTLLTSITLIVLLGRAKDMFKTIRTTGRPWWFAVGFAGVPMIVSTSWAAPILGVALSAVLAIGGQTIAGMILDAKGYGIEKPIPFSPKRILAATIAIGGLVFALGSELDELPDPKLAGLLGIIVFIAGMLLSVLNAGNGAVSGITRNPFITTITSVAGGGTLVVILNTIMWIFNLLPHPLFPVDSQWWMYLGGPTGMGIVLLATMSVRKLGAFGLTLLMVVGQMLTALFIDLSVTGEMNWSTVVSALMIVIAILITVQPKKSNKKKVNKIRN